MKTKYLSQVTLLRRVATGQERCYVHHITTPLREAKKAGV
jgi:hypothetical protein